MEVNKSNFGFLKFSIALFFLATPLESLPLAEGFSIVKLSAIIVLVAWALSGFQRKANNPTKVFVPLLVFAVISCVWSIDFSTSLNAITTFLIPSLLVAMIMSNSVNSKKDIAVYLGFYITGCLISSIAGLVTRQAMLAAAVYAGQERLTAFGQDQNTLAFLMVMGVVPLLQLISKTSKPILKYMFIALTIVFAYMIASTGSRTGVIVLALVVLFYAYSARQFKVLAVLGVLVVVGLPIFLQYLPEGIIDRFMQTSDLVEEGDFSDRGVIWQSALDAFFHDNFLLGVGYSNFSTMLRQHYGWQMASHNTYLTYLVEFGFVGVWTFVYVLVKMFKIATSIRKQENNAFVYCYVLPLFVFMITLETEYKRWIFMMYVLLYSWYKLNNEEKQNDVSLI